MQGIQFHTVHYLLSVYLSMGLLFLLALFKFDITLRNICLERESQLNRDIQQQYMYQADQRQIELHN